MTVVTTLNTTTALDIIKRALRMLGVYSTGEDLSPEESADGLAALNALLGSVSNGGMVSAKTLDSISLSATVASITVGPSGTVVTDRPVRVRPESYISLSGVSYPLDLLTLQQYNLVSVKADSGIPAGIYVQPDMPNITLTLWPVPSQAMTLNLWSDKLLASFPGLTSLVSLPPGYEAALPPMLAEEIAPEYEVPVPVPVAKAAARGRRVLKRTNLQVPTLSLDCPGIGYVADWRTGV